MKNAWFGSVFRAHRRKVMIKLYPTVAWYRTFSAAKTNKKCIQKYFIVFRLPSEIQTKKWRNVAFIYHQIFRQTKIELERMSKFRVCTARPPFWCFPGDFCLSWFYHIISWNISSKIYCSENGNTCVIRDRGRIGIFAGLLFFVPSLSLSFSLRRLRALFFPSLLWCCCCCFCRNAFHAK